MATCLLVPYFLNTEIQNIASALQQTQLIQVNEFFIMACQHFLSYPPYWPTGFIQNDVFTMNYICSYSTQLHYIALVGVVSPELT